MKSLPEVAQGTAMKLNTTAFAILLSAGLAGSTVTGHAQQPPTQSGLVATGPGKAAAAQTTTATATIVGIDKATREVKLKRHDGTVFEVTAGDEVRNFDRLKVGDSVRADFTQALTLELHKGGKGKANMSTKESMARAPVGGTPGAAVGRQVTVLADVTAVDNDKKTVTLKGPQGNEVDLNVQDPEQLKNIKVGDQVEAVYTESLAVKVEEQPKGAAERAPKSAPE
jgi:Cu/Ag efflux protein CusF